LKESNIRVTDIYRGPGGLRYFDFWATAECIRLTAQEDPAGSSSVFEPSWTRIGVSNLKSATAWYHQNVGMLTVEVNEKEGYAIMSLGVNHKPDNVSLWVLEQLPIDIRPEKIDASVRPYGFVESRHDFFTYHQNLRSRGIDVSEIGGFMEKGLVAFHFYDPDGNRLNIMSF
jgi:catechol-2,3-dioxygenase